jgi:hypothetical protein
LLAIANATLCSTMRYSGIRLAPKRCTLYVMSLVQAQYLISTDHYDDKQCQEANHRTIWHNNNRNYLDNLNNNIIMRM